MHKSRPQGATDGGYRRYDLPGASLRGPYKLWIPKTDNRHSESENEGARPAPSSSYRPHAHHGSTSHVAAATTSASTARHPTATSNQHAQPAPQKQRTERTPVGYSSESTIHAPVNPSKPSSSFSLFKPHLKESRGQSSSTTRREELPRSTTAPAAVPSRHTTSQPVSVPQSSASRNATLQNAVFGSYSTPSSTDPSPRSSTDSARNGHASAPAAAAGYSDPRKQQSNSTWNPYVDARIDRTSTSRRNETSSAIPRRDEKKTKDKEDMVARVTEALGGGSTGKAKAVETALLNNQAQTVRRDDIGATRRATSSTGTRGVENQPYSQPQAPSSSRRQKTTPQSTPFPGDAHLPENTPKSSRPSASSRAQPEVSSRSFAPPEPPTKVSSSHSKVQTTSSSKLPHPRSASSPWPFNQALPPEQIMPAKPQAHSSSWKQPFARFQGSSTQQTPDHRLPPKESTVHSSSRGPSDGIVRDSQHPYTPSAAPHQQSSKNSLPRSTQPPSHTATTMTPAPPRAVPPPAPAPAPPPPQTRTNPSYATTSTEPQRWSPNTVAPGRPAYGTSGAQPSQSTPQTPWPATPKYPETISAHQPTPEPSPVPTPKRYPGDDVQSNTTNAPAPAAPQRSGSTSNVGLQSHSESRNPLLTTSRYPERNDALAAPGPPLNSNGRYLTISAPSAPEAPAQPAGRLTSASTTTSPWPTTSRHPEQRSDPPAAPEPVPGRSLAVSTPSAPETPVPVAGISVSASTTNPLWPTTPRYLESVTPVTVEPTVSVNTGRNALNDSLATSAPPAGTWTSKYTQESYPASDSETDFTLKELTTVPVHQTIHTETNGPSSNPPLQTIGTSTPEKIVAGAWTPRYAAANMSASTFEVIPAQKPSPRATGGDGATGTAYKYATVAPPAPEPTNRGLRYVSTSTTQQAAPAPGAWTTSTRYATNTSGSIFDSSPTKGVNGPSRETSARQATLGTTPVAGAWTTKQTSGSGTPSSSESTAKHTPASQTPVSQAPAASTPSPSSLLKPPPPASGTNTGTSTPSSTQISDIINQLSSPVTSHSISTRVPISGHPSTPAPVRPALRATPPPLSISSTSPDTDSLLTPSSLNSPRSTIALPQSQPVSTITAAEVSHPPESVPRKNGFFDFFRPKPSLKSYEVWTPPARLRDRTREEQPKEPAPPPPKPKQATPVSVPPRPKSPKIFSPFKLFARRHRTVSSASLDVLDGTAPNTVMNSPASSMRADTPGAPPSPPLRDAFLATQEWRNREATELVVSGRKRRPRPGVTFDCPEDGAPVDILPPRLRIGRIQNDDGDDY